MKYVIYCAFSLGYTLSNLIHDILELHHGDTDQPVLPAEAVVLHADMELVGRQLVFVSDYTEQRHSWFMY